MNTDKDKEEMGTRINENDWNADTLTAVFTPVRVKETLPRIEIRGYKIYRAYGSARSD